MLIFNIGDARVAASGVDQHQGLQAFVAKYDLNKHAADNNISDKNTLFNNHYSGTESGTDGELESVDLQLHADELGLSLTWRRTNPGGGSQESLNCYIDVVKTVKQYRSFPAPKQGAFNQALGKKSRSIIDGTGGWGGDALLMCAQGYEVTIIERNPIMALLLSDAMTRLTNTKWALDNRVVVPKVRQVDSIDALGNLAEQADCVYLDPMFPPKKKKSAATNKNMQLLQYLVGEDHDASELVAAGMRAGARRIAVKRPDYAQPLYAKPAIQFTSKLVHYDVYLKTV